MTCEGGELCQDCSQARRDSKGISTEHLALTASFVMEHGVIHGDRKVRGDRKYPGHTLREGIIRALMHVTSQ